MELAEPPVSALLLADDSGALPVAPAVDVDPAGLDELVVSAELRDGDPDGDVLAALDCVPDGDVVALAELEGEVSDGARVEALDELDGDDGAVLVALDELDGGGAMLVELDGDDGVAVVALDELDGDDGVAVVALDELDGGVDGAVVVVEEVLVLSRSTERSQAVRASALAIARDISIGFMGSPVCKPRPGECRDAVGLGLTA